MKHKEFAALAIALAIFLFVGCNYNKIIIRQTPSDGTLTVNATATDATATDAQTAVATTQEPTTLKTYDFSQLKYSARSAAVACYDVRENRYLYERNTLVGVSPASLTKIVTACVALKYVDPSAVFTVGEEIKLTESNSSLCFIRIGQQVTLYDLLCGMLLASGNDAAYTVAVNVARAVSPETLDTAGAVSYFVGLMNEFGAALGLTGSHFVNPDGWDDPTQYMTLNDVVTVARYAIQLAHFREIVEKTTYAAVFVSGETITWKNSNLMMDATSPYYTEGVQGIKTGTTGMAGKCLIVYYQDEARSLIVASMGNPTEEERYYSVREIIDTVKYQY